MYMCKREWAESVLNAEKTVVKIRSDDKVTFAKGTFACVTGKIGNAQTKQLVFVPFGKTEQCWRSEGTHNCTEKERHDIGKKFVMEVFVFCGGSKTSNYSMPAVFSGSDVWTEFMKAPLVEQKPVKKKLVEKKPVEKKPVDKKLIQNRKKLAEWKPVEKKSEKKPIEKKPVEKKPVAVEKKPVEKKRAREPESSSVEQALEHLAMQQLMELSGQSESMSAQAKERDGSEDQKLKRYKEIANAAGEAQQAAKAAAEAQQAAVEAQQAANEASKRAAEAEKKLYAEFSNWINY